MKYEIIIIGAGIMGASTAYELSKRGKSVLLVDQFTVENDKNSSQDYSRAFRYEYGTNEFYTNLAVECLPLWKGLEEKYGKKIYFPCGMLLLGDEKDTYAYTSYKTLKKLGHKVSLFTRDDLSKLYPQFSAEYGVFDHNAGVIDAKEAVRAFIAIAKENGVHILENAKVIDIRNKNIFLQNGLKIEYEKLVITAGAWVNKLLPNKLPIKITKQQLVYFKPKNEKLFSKDKFPIFSYDDKGFYGFPIHGIQAIKIANHLPGENIDPDCYEDLVKDEFISICRKFFEKYIPGLQAAEVIKTKVGFYDMSPNEEFILESIGNNIVIGAGFSGHGFKFAPIIGKTLASMAAEDEFSKARTYQILSA